ncbi:hypothetical protein FACS1894161_2470 [Spirochaetia bacterium]|nr:hypothetical protein FACS1894161_2470 [Spirochaetia bacterium]
MLNFLSPNNIYQVISNFGIFVLIAISIFIFKKIHVGKEGINFEKDDNGSNITLKTINQKINSCFENMEKQISAIQETDKIQSLDILRINFYLQKQPNETKLISGLRYLRDKGNGRTRDDICTFIKDHQELYNTILAIEPTLKLEE